MSNKYKHSIKYGKTSLGKTLAIRDNVVYLDGKPAPQHYEWYDKENGNRYGVNKDGTYKLLATAEKEREYVNDWNKVNRQYFKDFDYEIKNQYISEEEKTARDSLYDYRNNFVNRRYDIENNYAIPQHLPGVKRRRLSEGTYRGIRVYDNTLDELYNVAKSHNIPFETILGLAAETSLGRDSHMAFYENKKDFAKAKKNPFYIQQFVDGDYLYPTDLLNNHNYYVGNNATGTINTLIEQNKIPGTKSWKDGQPFPYIGITYDKNGNQIFHELTDEQNKILSEENKKVYRGKEKSSDNPWTNSIDFYLKYNYGMGKGYPNTVSTRGKAIVNTPEIQEYLKQRRRLESNGQKSK